MKVVRPITAFTILAISSGLLSCDSEGRATTAAAVQFPIPTQLMLAREPAGAASGALLATQPIVHVRDANNSVVAGSSAPVDAVIAGGAGTLSGTTVVNAVNGIATFTDLSVSGSGAHSLAFTSRGLSAATSGPFNVTGAATLLEIGTQPTDAVSGSTFATPPVVRVRDADGNVVAGSSAAVTAAIASGPGTLSGIRTVNAVNGVTTFGNLSVTGTGAHTLRFTSAGTTPATSATFNVSLGPATRLVITTEPSVTQSAQPFNPQPVVQVRDAANGVVTSSTASVTAAIGSGPGTLSGTITVNAVNGIASFTNLAVSGTGAHTLTFTSGSLTPATTNSFIMTSPAPPPPPPPGGGTNEPGTFVLITERDFAAKVENSWLDRGDPSFTIQSEPTGPRPDDAVGQALFPAGFGAGSGPINTYYNVSGARTQLYIQFYFRVSPNWEGQQASINKVLFLWHGSSPSVFLNLGGSGSGPLYFRVNTQFPSSIQTRDFSFGNSAFGGIAIECVRGTWYLWEVLLESNTSANTPDGRIRSWVNGTLFADSNIEVPRQTTFPGIIMWETGASPNWTQVSWNPTWGGAGGLVANTMFQQIDYLRVSGNP